MSALGGTDPVSPPLCLIHLDIDWFMVVVELHLDHLGNGTDQSSQGPADTPGPAECGQSGLPRFHPVLDRDKECAS